MKRTNQGGSILSFVVLGVIMAVLLIGGAYIIRRTLTPADSSSTPIAQNDQNTPSTSSDQNDSSQSQDDENTPKDTDQKEDTTPAEQNEQPSLPTGGTDQAPHNLPTTGPADALFDGIVLSALVALLIVYMRSRRELASL